eukprot:4663948-Ditylum_brightwellii.AAC.1
MPTSSIPTTTPPRKTNHPLPYVNPSDVGIGAIPGKGVALALEFFGSGSPQVQMRCTACA